MKETMMLHCQLLMIMVYDMTVTVCIVDKIDSLYAYLRSYEEETFETCFASQSKYP